MGPEAGDPVRGLADVLRADPERGTGALVFEDLHWADSGLLDFVEHLLEWSRHQPLFVLTLARPELFDRRPGWGAGRRSFNSLDLEPLSDDAMSELLGGLVPGLPADVAGGSWNAPTASRCTPSKPSGCCSPRAGRAGRRLVPAGR